MRTIIYVDALNLYYRCLRNTEFKWLDLSALFTNLLDAKYQIKHINYFYANIKALPYVACILKGLEVAALLSASKPAINGLTHQT